jgi:signal peptidase I
MKTILMVTLTLMMMITGCVEETISDPHTPKQLEKVYNTEGMITFDYLSDGMDRGRHDLQSPYWGKIVVDPTYYAKRNFSRGDIVYYKTPKFKYEKNPRLTPPKQSISRIIALPGERIEIVKGQIYINGKKLDTFYGKALSRGLDKETYYKSVKDKNCNEECKETMRAFFETDMEEVKVPEGHLFIMGDTWWRSIDSQTFGPLAQENLIGKVVGRLYREINAQAVLPLLYNRLSYTLVTHPSPPQTAGTGIKAASLIELSVLRRIRDRNDFDSYTFRLGKQALDQRLPQSLLLIARINHHVLHVSVL